MPVQAGRRFALEQPTAGYANPATFRSRRGVWAVLGCARAKLRDSRVSIPYRSYRWRRRQQHRRSRQRCGSQQLFFHRHPSSLIFLHSTPSFPDHLDGIKRLPNRQPRPCSVIHQRTLCTSLSRWHAANDGPLCMVLCRCHVHVLARTPFPRPLPCTQVMEYLKDHKIGQLLENLTASIVYAQPGA